MAQDDTLFWFSYRDAKRQPWRVQFALPSWFESHRAEFGADRYSGGLGGLMDPASRTITISADEDRAYQDETLCHEMAHASAALFKLTAEKKESFTMEMEERVIAAISPRLYPVFRRMGLKWPRRPRGLSAFERRARREEKHT